MAGAQAFKAIMTIYNDQGDQCRKARREPLQHASKHLKTFDFPRKTPLMQCARTDQRHIATKIGRAHV